MSFFINSREFQTKLPFKFFKNKNFFFKELLLKFIIKTDWTEERASTVDLVFHRTIHCLEEFREKCDCLIYQAKFLFFKL